MAVRAPAFEEGLKWLNSAPLVLSELKGRYVLLDFFTFGCINCTNNIETIKKLQRQFHNELTVIGVHTPKFPHEKDLEALDAALKRLGVEYAVVHDVAHHIADAFAVKGWPTTILIDNRGYLVHHASGEQKFTEWSGRLSSCGLAAEYQRLPRCSGTHELRFPQKVLATKDFLAIANSGADEIWLSDYAGTVFELVSVNAPMGMAYEKEILYIAEEHSGNVLKYDVKTKVKEIFLEKLRNPYDLSIKEGVLSVALAGSHEIVQYDLESKVLLQSYGNRFEALRDGDAATCQLAQPSALAQMEEILYFVDAESSSLRKIESEAVSTLIGEGLFTFGDSNRGELLLQHPQGLCAGIIGDGCGGGRLFIADTFNNKIKAYYPEDGSMMTLLEGLDEPSGISKKGCELFITNTNEHEVIVFDLSKMEHRVMEFKFK